MPGQAFGLLAVALADAVLGDLAGHALRQPVDDLDVLGLLPGAKSRAAEIDQRLRRRGLAGAQRHLRHHGLAPFRVRGADHGHFAHRRVLGEHVLDRHRVDVVAAADDQELLAVGQVEVAVGIHVAEILRAQPLPVGIAEQLGILLRIVDIARDIGGAACPQLADLAGSEFSSVRVADRQVGVERRAPAGSEQFRPVLQPAQMIFVAQETQPAGG